MSDLKSSGYVGLAFCTTFDNLNQQCRHIRVDPDKSLHIQNLAWALEVVGVMSKPVYDYASQLCLPSSIQIDFSYSMVSTAILGRNEPNPIFEIYVPESVAIALKLRFHGQDHFEIRTLP